MDALTIATLASRIAMWADRLPPLRLRLFHEFVDDTGQERFVLSGAEVGGEGQLRLLFRGGGTVELWGPDGSSARADGVVIAHADRVRWARSAPGDQPAQREYESLADRVVRRDAGVEEQTPAAGRLLHPALELL